MSKRLKGLYTDTIPVDQPPNTYRDARNANINQDIGGISSEEGNRDIAENLPSGYFPIGEASIYDGRIVIFSASISGDSEIGILDGESYSQVLNDGDLNFNPTNKILSTVKIDNNDNAVIYWTDNNNPPRYLNLDDVPDYDDINQLNIFDFISNIGTMTLDGVNNSGGSLTSGSYVLAMRYIDKDGNESNFFNFTRQISIVRDIQDNSGEIQGNPTGGTSKSISISVSNLDTSFDYIQVAAIRYEGNTVAGVDILPQISISDDSLNFIYTGSETIIDGSTDEIAINKAFYNKAQAITQLDGVMYLGNLSRNESFDYQAYANNIKISCVTKTIDSDDSGALNAAKWYPGNETLVYYNRSFRREEVYAFYISFILEDGSETYAFHIPGREGTSAEKATISSSDSDNAVAIDDTAKRFHFFADAGENEMAYWENETETYPNTESFRVKDVNSSGEGEIIGDLREEPVRHHRFPHEADKPITEDYEASTWSESTILGISLRDIKIPSELASKVKAFKIYYAKKDASNRLVLDQGGVIGQQISNSLYANKVPDVGDEDFSDNYRAMGLHAFSSIKNKASLSSISYLRKVCAPLVTSSESTGVTEYNALFLLGHNAVENSDDEFITRFNAISHIDSHLQEVSITGLGFERNKQSHKEESQILIESVSDSSDDKFSLNYDLDGTLVGAEYGAIYNLMTLRKDLFDSFDQQELVWTGIIETNIDKFDPTSDVYDEGVKGSGYIQIEEDAPSEGSGSTASTTISISVGGAGNVGTGFDLAVETSADGHKNTVAISSGDTDEDIATAIESLVNGDSDYEYTANAVFHEVTFFWKTPTEDANVRNIVFYDDLDGDLSSTDVTITSNPAEFSGGADPEIGDAGDIEFEIDIEGTITSLSYTVQYGDNKLDIVNGLIASISGDDFSATLDDSNTHPRVYIESEETGSKWNENISESTNELDIDNTISGISDGEDATNFIENNYGGDTFINFFGYRITEDVGAKNVLFQIVESYENIAFRETGDEFYQLNGNVADFSDFMKLEDDDGEDTWYDNYFAYDEAHSRQHVIKSTIPYPKNLKELSSFNTRVIRSTKQDPSSDMDTFRIFLDNDFLDLPKNRGEIKNLAVSQNILLVHLERALFRTKGKEQLVTGDFRAYLGSGNIFEVQPDEIFSTKHGFAGIDSPDSALETDAGYFFVDEKAKRIFLIGEGPEIISNNGLSRFFDKNLKWYIDDVQDHEAIPYVGYSCVYDSEYNRILLTKVDYEPTSDLIDAIDAETIEFNSSTGKFYINDPGNERDIEYSETEYFTDKSFTLSYLPEIKAWVSFHDYTPLFYCSNIDSHYSYNQGDEKFYIHNDKEDLDYCNFYGNQKPFHIQVVENANPETSKQLVNFEYEIYPYDSDTGKIDWDKNFERFRIRNDIQDSDTQDIIYFTSTNGNARLVEGTWRINKFRDLIDPDTGEVDSNLDWHKQKKFIGKYALIDLYYDTPNNIKMVLVSLRGNFKQSHR